MLSRIELPYGLGARYKDDKRDYGYRHAGLVRATEPVRPAKVDNRHLFAHLPIWNQGKEGACVGMVGAAALGEIYHVELSPRDSLEKAKLYDEWPGEHYDGSSVRAMIKAAVALGVCEWGFWPFAPFNLSGKLPGAEQNARLHLLTSYERLRTLQEVLHAIWGIGYVLATIDVHTGWIEPTSKHRIRYNPRYISRGLHGVIALGYDEMAGYMLIRNSWRDDWADGGHAWIKFEDWIENMYDAWVVYNEESGCRSGPG